MADKKIPEKPNAKPKKKRRKLSEGMIVTLISAAATIVAAILSSPLLSKVSNAATPSIAAQVLVTSPTRPSELNLIQTANALYPPIPNEQTATVAAALTQVSIFNAEYAKYDLTATALAVPYPLNLTDKKGVQMLLVPAGKFIMGSEKGEPYEGPESILYLNAYYIDKYEVTNALYEVCVDAGLCRPPARYASASRSNYYGNPQYDNYPVVYVDWNMAKTYCDWRGARLPTEAEWEKAARGIDGRTYPWGESISCDKANYSFANDHCIGDTNIVGAYENGQSIYGIYDMAGNVWEWVSSLFQPYPYNPSDGREEVYLSGNHVVRGGSWFEDKDMVSSFVRRAGSSDGSSYVGFRCARDANP